MSSKSNTTYDKLKRKCNASLTRLKAEHTMMNFKYMWQMGTHAESPLPPREQSRLLEIDPGVFECPDFDKAVENIANVYNRIYEEAVMGQGLTYFPVVDESLGSVVRRTAGQGYQRASFFGWVAAVCGVPPALLNSSMVVGSSWKLSMSCVWPLYVDWGYMDTRDQRSALNIMETFLIEAGYDIIEGA